MRILDTEFEGLKIVELEPHEDKRGGFARAYCEREFQEAGINCKFVQDNLSYNHKKNTLRGMHWQKEPYGDDKLLRCIGGAVYDVVVDIRPQSKTFMKWFGIELTEDNKKALFIPKGFAHGYQTLRDNSTLYYKVSEFYHPEVATGLPFDDAKIGIQWKNIDSEMIISEQDLHWKTF